MVPAAPAERHDVVADSGAAADDDNDATDAFVASAPAPGSSGGVNAQPPLEASPSKQRCGDVRAVLVEGIDGRWFRGSSLWEFLPFTRRRSNATATAAADDEWHPEEATPKKRGSGDGDGDGDGDDEGEGKAKRQPPRFNWSLHKGGVDQRDGEEEQMELDDDGAVAAAAAAAEEHPLGKPRAQLPPAVAVAVAAAAAAAIDAPLPRPPTSTSSSPPLGAAGPATPPVGLLLQRRPSLQAPAPPPPSKEPTPEAPPLAPPSSPEADGGGGDGKHGRRTRREEGELVYSSLRARWAAAAASEDFKTVPPSEGKARELVPACRITTGARAAAKEKERAEADAAAARRATRDAAAASSPET